MRDTTARVLRISPRFPRCLEATLDAPLVVRIVTRASTTNSFAWRLSIHSFTTVLESSKNDGLAKGSACSDMLDFASISGLTTNQRKSNRNWTRWSRLTNISLSTLALMASRDPHFLWRTPTCSRETASRWVQHISHRITRTSSHAISRDY